MIIRVLTLFELNVMDNKKHKTKIGATIKVMLMTTTLGLYITTQIRSKGIANCFHESSFAASTSTATATLAASRY
jgi:hypothetical protein